MTSRFIGRVVLSNTFTCLAWIGILPLKRAKVSCPVSMMPLQKNDASIHDVPPRAQLTRTNLLDRPRNTGLFFARPVIPSVLTCSNYAGPHRLLERFSNYCGPKKIARSGFP